MTATLELCPVCHRIIAVSPVQRIVFSHHDKLHQHCPMGGHTLGGEAA